MSNSFRRREGIRPGVATLTDAACLRTVEAAAAGSWHVEAGGTSVTTVLAVAQVAAPIVFIGSAGDDASGQMIRRALAGRSVAWPSTPRANAVTAQCLIEIGDDGERTLLTHLGAAGRVDAADLEDLPDPRILLTEVYQFDGVSAGSVFEAFARSGADHRVLTLSDVRVVRRHRQAVLDLLRGVPCTVIGTAHETAALLDCTRDSASAAAAAQAFLASSASADGCEIVMTDGPRDAHYVTRHGMAVEPALRVRPVDLTGAGDLFCAGVVLGLLAGAPPAERLRRGHRLAAAAVSAIGTLHVDVPAALGARC